MERTKEKKKKIVNDIKQSREKQNKKLQKENKS